MIEAKADDGGVVAVDGGASTGGDAATRARARAFSKGFLQR